MRIKARARRRPDDRCRNQSKQRRPLGVLAAPEAAAFREKPHHRSDQKRQAYSNKRQGMLDSLGPEYMWNRMVCDRPEVRLAQDALLAEYERDQAQRSEESGRQQRRLGDAFPAGQRPTPAISRQKQINSERNSGDRRRLFEQKSSAQEETGEEEFGPEARRAAPQGDRPCPNHRKIHQ